MSKPKECSPKNSIIPVNVCEPQDFDMDLVENGAIKHKISGKRSRRSISDGERKTELTSISSLDLEEDNYIPQV